MHKNALFSLKKSPSAEGDFELSEFAVTYLKVLLCYF